jgi:hypothetical protein
MIAPAAIKMRLVVIPIVSVLYRAELNTSWTNKGLAKHAYEQQNDEDENDSADSDIHEFPFVSVGRTMRCDAQEIPGVYRYKPAK